MAVEGTSREKGRRLRIMYQACLADVVGTYRKWKEDRDDPREVSITYSSQFFDFCRNWDIDAYVYSANPDAQELEDGRFRFTQRLWPLPDAQGLYIHLRQLAYAWRVIRAAIRYRPDVLVMADGAYWFPLALLRPFGIKIVPTLHCVLWPKYRQPRLLRRTVNRLNGWFFRHFCFAIMVVSDEIAGQVKQLAGPAPAPFVAFLPQYRASSMDAITAEDHSRQAPFRVLYAGRVEREKGVFDIVEMARLLKGMGRTDIVFDLCGAGGCEDELEGAVKSAGLGDIVIQHGVCSRASMKTRLSRSHVVLVPTRSGFPEGFNKVVVEGIIAGRPVVTSSVCPAVSYVGDAVEVVPPDSPQAYVEALIRLSDDTELYERRRAACGLVRNQFFDFNRSWYSALERIVRACAAETIPPEISWLPSGKRVNDQA